MELRAALAKWENGKLTAAIRNAIANATGKRLKALLLVPSGLASFLGRLDR